jgi:hypothetical protein
MVAGGVISVVSWYFPVALAASPWLNFDVPFGYIAGAYFGVLVLGLALAMTAVALFVRMLAAPITAHVPKHRAALGLAPTDEAAKSARHLVSHYRTQYRAEVAQKREELAEALEKVRQLA